MNPYEIHKALINTYVLQKKGDTALLKRDTSKDKTDTDILRNNHKFLWGSDLPKSWEEEIAKKYYDKLFKEYCICDLTYYKFNKVALRWRVEKEVIDGKGQFICADKRCNEKESLRSWEVNFGYVEDGQKKNALVKIRLCIDCSAKLNYKTKKREVKRLQKKRKVKKKKGDDEKKPEGESSSSNADEENDKSSDMEDSKDKPEELEETNAWTGPLEINEKTREEEIDDYLSNLLF